MSIANFGSFLGGMAQGQQAAENQRERAAYLLMLQKKQKDEDEDKQTSRQALFDTEMASGMGSTVGTDAAPKSFTDVFGAGATPMPQQPPQQPQPQTPQPGQPSQPMMQPGARPMPQPAMQPGAQPMPQQGPAVPPQQPPQAAPGVQAQQPPQAPQTPQSGYAKAQQIYSDMAERMKTPEAQEVAKDPKVQKAQSDYHAYIKELQAAGITPGGQKPDLVQMKRLSLLHDQLEVASAEAAKHVGADRKAALDWGKGYAEIFVKQEAAKQAMDRVNRQQEGADKRAGMRAERAGGGGGGAASFGEMSQDALRNLAEDYQRLGPSVLPWSRSRNQGGDIVKFQNWMADNGYGASAGNRADYKADTKSLGNVTQQADVARKSYGALDSNVELMLSLAKEYGLKANQPMNSIVNKLRQMNDPRATNFELALNTVQREYAKLAEGGSGAAAAHVSSIENASKQLGANFTYEQLQGAAKTLKQDGKNILDAWDKQVQDVKGRTRASTSGRSAGSDAGGFVGADGTDYSDADVKAAMKATGLSRAELMKRAGVK